MRLGVQQPLLPTMPVGLTAQARLQGFQCQKQGERAITQILGGEVKQGEMAYKLSTFLSFQKSSASSTITCTHFLCVKNCVLRGCGFIVFAFKTISRRRRGYTNVFYLFEKTITRNWKFLLLVWLIRHSHNRNVNVFLQSATTRWY